MVRFARRGGSSVAEPSNLTPHIVSPQLDDQSCPQTGTARTNRRAFGTNPGALVAFSTEAVRDLAHQDRPQLLIGQ